MVVFDDDETVGGGGRRIGRVVEEAIVDVGFKVTGGQSVITLASVEFDAVVTYESDPLTTKQIGRCC